MQPIEMQEYKKKIEGAARIRHLETNEYQGVVCSQYPNSSEYNEKITVQ